MHLVTFELLPLAAIDISFFTKVWVYNTLVIQTLPYSSECRTLGWRSSECSAYHESLEYLMNAMYTNDLIRLTCCDLPKKNKVIQSHQLHCCGHQMHINEVRFPRLPLLDQKFMVNCQVSFIHGIILKLNRCLSKLFV